MTENNGTPRRRNLRGQKVQLRNGGWLRLLPQADNILFQEKWQAIQAEIRQEKGLPIDAEVSKHLSPREFATFMARASIGTVVTEWGDFEMEEGQDWPCKRPDGSLNEEAGVELLLSPGMTSDFLAAIGPLNEAYERDMRIAEGNLPEPSAGSSDTEG